MTSIYETRLRSRIEDVEREERNLLLKRQEETFGKTANLCEICLNLRAGVNGASDPWRDSEIAEAIEILQGRLFYWKDSVPKAAEPFDNAVKAMVEAALAEVEHYKKS